MTAGGTTGRDVWFSIKAHVSTTILTVTRDGSLFFIVVLPIAIIVIVGSTFANASAIEIAVVGQGREADEVVAALDDLDSVEVVRLDDVEDARRALRRYDAEAAVVIEGDLAERGAGIIINETNGGALAARAIAARVVDRVAFPAEAEPTPVLVERVGDQAVDLFDAGPFALSAAQNLVLFTFINSLTSAAILVRSRRDGVLRRSLAAPPGAGAILLGLGVGWFVLALAQSLIILVIGALVFGVSWGDPPAAVALLGSFALVGTGAGLLVGASLDSEEQTSAITPPLGLVLAALGGCMVPTEIFSDTMLAAARLTPHYWALEGWKTLIFRDGTLADVADRVLVLLLVAAVLLALASVILRRRLTRA